MEKELILFDWDDTLFCKNEFIRNLGKNLADAYQVQSEDILELEKKYIDTLDQSGDFRIDNFLEYLGENFNKKIGLDDFVSDKLGIYSESLFADTVPALDKLKNNFKLGIYSQGFDDIQKIKIKSSGLKDFFEEQWVYIDKNKLNLDLVKKMPEGSIIVDDKKEVVEKLKLLNRFKIIWINRNTDEKIEGVVTIKSLEELIDLANPENFVHK
ncbi:MAG: HAD hydrolase-like protein [Candidatus Shapirobacteria bacterium]|nr:HAD hydrolase-like protein [Candidatus Shapirobacteria bacterium]MDD3002394.1 HAD hydrolase-like protein [Candidatus Shapirobacteria bacterium]MDD4383298.1 HAD hydrolase-like protein [Candidatus Shapirobacteria bacterium]